MLTTNNVTSTSFLPKTVEYCTLIFHKLLISSSISRIHSSLVRECISKLLSKSSQESRHQCRHPQHLKCTAKSHNPLLSFVDSTYFLILFLEAALRSLVLRDNWTKPHHSSAPEVLLDFRHVASFRNYVDSKATRVENWGQISHFLTPLKFREGWAKCIEWTLPVQLITPLIHFWQGASRQPGRRSGVRKDNSKTEGFRRIHQAA